MAVVGLTAAPAAHATTLPYGSYVFDGTVSSVVQSGTNVFVGGTFTHEQKPTGGGLILNTSGSGDPNSETFPKVTGTVNATVADGSGGWYIGGYFTRVGGTPRSNLAHILADGTVDSTFTPNPDDQVQALALSAGELYVGGFFSHMSGQARNGLAAIKTSDATLTAFNPNPVSDGGFGADVSELTASRGILYVAGQFNHIGGQTRSYLAALSTSTGLATAFNPNPTSPNQVGSLVSALALSGDKLYVGGQFQQIGGQARNGLAALNTSDGTATTFNPNPDGNPNPDVAALAVSAGTLYVSGEFSHIGGQARNGLAAVATSDGTATAFNPNPDGPVQTLAASGDALYVGGAFTRIGGQARNDLARLSTTDGTAAAFDANPNGRVFAVAVENGTLYAGGDFTAAGPALATVGGVAKLDAAGDLDTSFDPNPNPSPDPDADGVQALAIAGSNLYVGGGFTQIGGQARHHLAAVSISTGSVTAFNPNPTGANANGGEGVYALIASNNVVYVGGGFTQIGGQARNDLAAVRMSDGTATGFSANPNGANVNHNEGVYALALSGSTLYVGGTFTHIGGLTRNALGAVNTSDGTVTAFNPSPTTSDPIGTGVFDLALSGSTLYAAGTFDRIAGAERHTLAAIDTGTGTATAFNPDPNGDRASAVALSDGTIYAGGSFGQIGGQDRDGLAALDMADGGATAFDPAVHGDVHALAVSGDTVYAGGNFDDAEGQITGPFAVLDGTASPPPVDTTAPIISVTTPSAGEHIMLGATVTPQVTCTDEMGGSGVVSCSYPATVDTANAGNHTFTVTATDHAGNHATTSVMYVVDAPADSGGGGNLSNGSHGSPSGDGTLPPSDGGHSTAPTVSGPAPAAAAAPPTPTPIAPVTVPALTGSPSTTTAGAVTVSLRCPTGAACRGRLSLTVTIPKTKKTRAKTVTAGSTTYSIPASQTKKLTIKLNATGRKLLKSGHERLAVSLQITPSGDKKPASTHKLTLHAKKPRATKKH